MARPLVLPARVTVYLSADEAQALELVAARDERSQSYILRQLWLEQLERETIAERGAEVQS